MKTLLYTHDSMLVSVWLPCALSKLEETKNLFVGKCIQGEGIEIPEELVLRMKAAYLEVCKLSDELSKIKGRGW